MLRTIACAAVALSASSALGQNPRLGGSMMHLLVSLDDSTVNIEFETDPQGPLSLQNYGETYSGAASVLNGTSYNAQFGWLAGGFISLPPDSGIFVEPVSMTNGLSIHDAFSFAPIMGTDGSDTAWQWGGLMTHHWVSTRRPGLFEATMQVYVGDLSGAPRAGYTPGFIDLSWENAVGPFGQGSFGNPVGGGAGPVPVPSSALALGLGVIGLRRRR